MSLARLLAHATHMVETEGADHQAVHSSSPIQPSCTEPYCGGWWAEVPGEVQLEVPSGQGSKVGSAASTKSVDFPEVSFFPAFDPPLARVKLSPHGGPFDRWNIPNAVTVKVGTWSELKFLTHEVLNNFMRVQEDAGLGEPEHVVRSGLQLISWKSPHGKLHVTPFLGSKREMMNSHLPITFT